MSETYTSLSPSGFIWDRPGIPRKDWICVDIDDRDEPVNVCEMCGNRQVRYIHIMAHPEYPYNVEVGCVCASKMEQDYVAPKRREKALKKRTTKRKKWLTQKWETSWKGFHYKKIIVHDVLCQYVGVYTKPYPPDSGDPRIWAFYAGDYHHKVLYYTEVDAQLALFDYLYPTKFLTGNICY